MRAILAASLLAVATLATIEGVLASAAAVVVLLGIPAFAMAWATKSLRPEADIIEVVTGSFGGVGLACLALWTSSLLLGPVREFLIAAPILAAIVVVATVPARPESSGRGPGPAGGRFSAGPWIAGSSALFAAIVSVPFLPYGWIRHDGVHRMGMTDWYKHLSVSVTLATDSTFPPGNPFLATDSEAPYYYGFHLLAAWIDRTGAQSVEIYPILLAMTLLTAAAVPAVIFVVSRDLVPDARKALTAALAGTFLAGFDALVVAVDAVRNLVRLDDLEANLSGLRSVIPSTHLDYWIHHNERQFNPPYVATIWAPHHVAAVLLALLALHEMWRSRGDSDRVGVLVIPAVLLASIPAISAYVAVAVAVGASVCAPIHAWCLWRRRGSTRALRRWLIVGCLAAVLATPVLWVLHLAPTGALTIHVSSAGGWQNGAVFSSLLGDFWWTRLLDTPALLVFELGLVGVLGAHELLRRQRRGSISAAGRSVGSFMLAVILFTTFVRPPVDGPNNLYARPMLMVWCLAAPFAVVAWHRIRERGLETGGVVARALMPALLVATVGLPFAVTGATLEGALFWATPRELVSTFDWVNANTRDTALVATAPQELAKPAGYWLRRRLLVGDRRHAVLFGAEPDRFDEVHASTRQALRTRDPARAAARFDSLGASVAIVESPTPPGWARPPWFRIGHRSGRYLTIIRSEEPDRPSGRDDARSPTLRATPR